MSDEPVVLRYLSQKGTLAGMRPEGTRLYRDEWIEIARDHRLMVGTIVVVQLAEFLSLAEVTKRSAFAAGPAVSFQLELTFGDGSTLCLNKQFLEAPPLQGLRGGALGDLSLLIFKGLRTATSGEIAVWTEETKQWPPSGALSPRKGQA